MFSDRVNFDYEFSLFEKDYKQNTSQINLNKEFEYIYFYFSNPHSKLCPYKEYQPDYLEYLISLGLVLPSLDCNLPKKNWWGDDENLELAKILNSKITSVKIGQENSLNPDGISIIENYEEIQNHLKLFTFEKWIARDPYKMAGSGSLIFDRDELEENKGFFTNQLKKAPLILSPYFSRLMDLGFIFEKDKFNVTWNLNSKSGRFKGGIVFKNNKMLENIIGKISGFDFEKVLNTEKKINHIYKKLGNKGILQIDSFIYTENNSNKFYPLVEVNARKSMGYFINNLTRFLPEDGVGLFLSLNTSDLRIVKNFKERLKSLGDLLYLPSSKMGVIPLSPIDGRFMSFFICGLTLEKVAQVKDELWKVLSLPGKVLSPAYNFMKTV